MQAKKNVLLPAIIAGVVLGIFSGVYFPEFSLSLEFVGDIFLNLLKMMVIPLIIVSITLGVMKLRDFKTVGAKTLIYYMTTTAISVCIGIAVVSLINPGAPETLGTMTEEMRSQAQVSVEGKNMGVKQILDSMITSNVFKSATDFQILPLIVFSLLFGLALARLGDRAAPLESVLTSLDGAIMKLVHWIITLTPLGVACIIAARIGKAGGGEAIYAMAAGIGKYMLAVVVGLGIHGLVVLPLVLFVFTRRNPLQYIKHMSKALLTAFSTASSSATLPLTMTNAIEDAKVSRRVGNFVLPLGATINMDGTALYEAVAVIFIAQVYAVPLDSGALVIIFLTATLAAIGAAGIPEAGLVTMVIVLTSVGLPLEGIGLLLSVDWLLDRFRTTVNVWGDSVGAAVVDSTAGG
ncbi:MAG: cation:dicarboxylase symporter family transporter [Candidatus Mycalebacterium zealandia]|nr:MAG: cation:dicarboxylase symporter family transporter [Candidatus Mycalebacterium zealandia]